MLVVEVLVVVVVVVAVVMVGVVKFKFTEKYDKNHETDNKAHTQALQKGLFKPNLCYGLGFLGSLEFLPLRERNASQQVTILRLRRRSLR